MGRGLHMERSLSLALGEMWGSSSISSTGMYQRLPERSQTTRLPG